MPYSQPELTTTVPSPTNDDDGDDSEEESSSHPSGFDRFNNENDLKNLIDLLSIIQNTFQSPTNNVSTAANDVNNTTTISDSAAAATTTANDVNNTTTTSAATTTANDVSTTTTTTDATSAAITTANDVNNTNTTSDAAAAATNTTTSDAAATTNNDADRNQLTLLEKDTKHLVKNVEYIHNNLESLKACPNGDRAEELLNHLMDAAQNQSADDFEKHSKNLHYLLQIVSKLKHWVPPQRPEESGNAKEKNSNSKKKKKESPIVSKKDKDDAAAEIVKALVGYSCEEWGMDGLLKSYGELGNTEKLCLLCFSVFPCDVEKVKTVSVQTNLVIKKKILIYWWVGEGFIDLTLDQNLGENQTIEKTGEEIFKELKKKGFIEPVMKRGRESGSYQMHSFVHSFVTALAMKAGFFDFSKEDGKLTARFMHSHRACLLNSQGNSLSSSCKIWKGYIDDCNKLKKSECVQTLFNVNEPIIDIQPEWFSKMKYLSVLHLGSWRSDTGDHIEVEDPKFLEDLKGMKQLKLFSLQGVSTIMRLPDSVCKLDSLVILDLRECHNLEELPSNIGSLKNLTHLDITNCHLLTKLPKGISLLSKLEVLNGFVIYNQSGDQEVEDACFLSQWYKKAKRCVVHDLFRRENKELCTLRDLLELGNLRELSLVVNRESFPNNEEVKVFKEMSKLHSLKISWEKSFKDVNPNEAGANQGNNNASEEPRSNCGWCFPGKNPEAENTHRGVGQEAHISVIKLELWCFPGESAPDWLVPNELKSLKKLYIKGGNLTDLGLDGNVWNVETLRLKYLRNLEIEWRTLIKMFPSMTYLEKYECKKLGLFPSDHEGVWKKKGLLVCPESRI